MSLKVMNGTIRLIARPGMRGGVTAPLIGFVIAPMPDGAEPGDLVEVYLLSDGTATWRVLRKQVMTDLLESGNVNAMTFDRLYEEGHAGALCWPDLLAERERVEGMSDLELLR